MTPEIDPAEADLGFAVSKRRRAEENFPGAARILGHLEDGPPRKRVGLTVDGKLPVREGAKLFDGEDEIGVRSEEHTSELQSLMRISYAVSCLKKKTKPKLTSNKDTN